MINFDHARVARAALVTGVLAAGFGLAGCMASPTYGTDKTANQQLLEDMTGVLSIRPKKGPEIEYKPRPELVKPETMAVLPPPQDDVTTASNQQWPESNEERLVRIRAEGTENRDNPYYRPNVVFDTAERNTEVTYDDPILANMGNRERHEEMQRRRIQASGGSASSRQYLSEPPIDYRRPAETAPVGDLGESEWKKERRARRESRTASTEEQRPRPNPSTIFSN